MPSDGNSRIEGELHEVKGGLDLLFTLREEFAQWVEEAQDASKHEALENVLAHIEVLESEYHIRREKLKQAQGSA